MTDRKSSKNFLLFFIVLSLIIFLADRFHFLDNPKSFFEKKLVIPVRTIISGLIAKAPSPQEKICQDQSAEIAALKTQIAGFKEENLSARRLLGAPLPSDWRFRPVKIISASGEEIMIGFGIKDGITKDLIAVYQGFYLGKVYQVSQDLAKIRLASSPETKETVKIIGSETLVLTGKGLLQGKGSGKMEIKEILAEEEVKQGDIVVISLAGFDLPVGKIIAIDYLKGEVFKKAEAVTEINLRPLETIFLVSGKI